MKNSKKYYIADNIVRRLNDMQVDGDFVNISSDPFNAINLLESTV